MATTNVGKPFGVVTSKNQATAITESKRADNAGQFYITRTNNSNTGGVGNTEGNASEAISLTINGNVLRGISKDDATKLASLSTNTGGSISNLMVGAGLTKTENTINLNLGSGIGTDDDSKLMVKTSGEIIIKDNYVTLDVDTLSGTTKDTNLFYYSKGGIYFGNTIKSGQKFDKATESGTIQNPLNYMRLRCGTGLKFQEGYCSPGDSSNQVLGHDGCYYINIDNTTIGLNTNSKLRVKHDNTLSESSSGLSIKLSDGLENTTNGLSVKLPNVSSVPSLQSLPISTSAILVKDSSNGLCVDIPALTRLVKLIMAAK